MALINTEPWGTRVIRGRYTVANGWEEFIGVGILPVVVLWGAAWILQGFKKDKKRT